MKKLGVLFLSLLFSTALVTGCTSGGDSGDSGGNQGNGDSLPYSLDQVKNKLLTLGQQSGFEITVKAEGSSSDGTAGSGVLTFGLVQDVFWIDGTGAYKKVDTGVEVYDYQERQYIYQDTTSTVSFNDTVSSMTEAFYYAYEYVKNSQVTLTKVSDVTFLNRRAYQYEASLVVVGAASASFTVIIDVETGITLKFAAKAMAGEESGEAAVEVTSFKVGREVTVPELVKKGGTDPSGEIPTAGTYLLDESQSQNIGIYKGGSIIINKDGTGLFVDYADYLGEKHYYTGSFVLDDDDIVMTTVRSILESNGQTKTDVPTGGTILTFEYIGEQSYAITLDTAYCVYKFDHAPVDPSVERFLINKSQYTSIITNMDYLDYDQSASFLVKEYRGPELVYTTTFKSAKGVYQEDVLDNLYLRETNSFYEAVSGQPGYYYHYKYENNKWQKEAAAQYESSDDDHSHFGQSAGIYYLSLIPFEILSEPSGTVTFYRHLESYTVNQVTFKDIDIMFVDGKLYQVSYIVNGSNKFDVSVSGVGETSVTLPEIQDQETPEDCSALISEREGTTYTYEKIVNDGYNQDEAAAIKTMYENKILCFFGDNSAEIREMVDEIEVVSIGEFNATKKPSDTEAVVELKTDTQYVGGIKDEAYRGENIILKYSVRQQELSIGFSATDASGNKSKLDVVFKNANTVPEHYKQEDLSVYPADAISDYLAYYGLRDERVPEFKVDGGSYEFNKEGLLTITLNASTSSSDALAVLMGIAKNAGFMKYVVLSEGSSTVMYVSRSNKLAVIFGANAEGTAVQVMFKVFGEDEPFNGSTVYPQADIDRTYPLGTRDSLPELSYEGVTYLSVSGDKRFTFYITPQDGQDASVIVASLIRVLTSAEYRPNESDVYVSPNGDIEVSITSLLNGLSIMVDVQFKYEVISCVYTIVPKGEFTDWGKDDAQLYAYVWNYKSEGRWIALRASREGNGYILECDSTWIGCKIVRFATNSEIGWEGADGSVNPNVEIWDESADVELSGSAQETLKVELFSHKQ